MSIERHSRARQIELGQSLACRRKIYLDTCFWIVIRDTLLGVRNDPPARKLLHHLRRGVSNSQLVCPISAPMFLELMKQPYTPDRRIGTARLIDELSLGVTMVPSWSVMSTEIHALLSRTKGGADLYPMQELIWTKVAYILGNTYPSLSQVSPTEELITKKSFFDHLWDYSLSDMIKIMSDKLPLSDRFNDLSCETNAKNLQHRDELRSFAQTYDIELRGIIEIAGELAADVLHQFAEKEAGHELSSTPEQRANSVNVCRNLLYHAFKKPETRDVLRSLHIGASIHAGMRWDKARKFKPNDYYDFEHATVALSYCDAFLTEGSLHHLVTRPQLDLESVNGCKIFSDVEAAADYVRQLLSPR